MSSQPARLTPDELARITSGPSYMEVNAYRSKVQRALKKLGISTSRHFKRADYRSWLRLGIAPDEVWRVL